MLALLLLAALSLPQETPSLARVRGVRLSEDLGQVAPLAPLSLERLVSGALRPRDETGGTTPDGAGLRIEPLPPRPALAVEAHRRRLQSVAAWMVQHPIADAPYEVEVVGVIDARTFEVRPSSGGEPFEAILYGVLPPYGVQPFGDTALAFVEAELARCGRRLTLISIGGKGKRINVCALVPNGEGGVEPLGERLLRHGLAWWNEGHATFDFRLRDLEHGARDGGIGLFSQQERLSPVAFRQLAEKRARGGYRFGGEVLAVEVLEVSDGDTLRVRAEEGADPPAALGEYLDAEGAFVVRVAGVDTPEIDQPGGVQAWALATLACGEAVGLVLLDDGGYGRVAARVICADGEPLGEKLVRTGRARHYERYLPDARLESLETAARRAGLGLWASPWSILPATWRGGQQRAGFWRFDGDGVHHITLDADDDPRTTGDQRVLTVDEYRETVVHTRFLELCRAWKEVF